MAYIKPFPVLKRSNVELVVFEDMKKQILRGADDIGFMEFDFIETDDNLDALLAEYRPKVILARIHSAH